MNNSESPWTIVTGPSRNARNNGSIRSRGRSRGTGYNRPANIYGSNDGLALPARTQKVSLNNLSPKRELKTPNKTDGHLSLTVEFEDYSYEDSDSSSSSETPQSVPPYRVDLVILCPFCNCPENPITDSTALAAHIKEQHKIQFINLHHVSMTLEKYLEYWAKNFVNLRKAGGGQTIITIDPEKLPEDKRLREELQHEKLNEILNIQSWERERDAKAERKCLFCKSVGENRNILFRHMFTEHNFNIGLPDNIVNVNEFLDILERKLNNLQCLYCEKIFTSPVVLRKHMRKKKHFKINARNRIYDKFYVINYLEPGKNWENFENEKYDSDEDRRDDSWEDWNEPIEPEPTMCLFCENVAQSPREVCVHMKQVHNFDLWGIKREMGLDFYQTIILINYIRHRTSFLTCMACNASFDELQKMTEHMHQEDCFSKVPGLDNPLWKNPQYLFPVYENDHLLTGFEECKESDEDDEDEPLCSPDDTIILPEKSVHDWTD